MAEHCGIPKILLDRWHLDDDQLLAAIRAGELGDLTISSLLKSHLEAFIDRQNAEQSRGRPLPSLKSMALAEILRVLDSAEDLNDTAQYIVSNLNEIAIRDLLTDPRMRYPVLRACLTAANKYVEAGRDFIDIDEAVYYNARYILARGTDNVDNAYLLTLEDFCKILPVVMVDKSNRYGRLTRQNPPKGGLEILDAKRKSAQDFYTSSLALGDRLQEVTRHVLQGLDWKNVLLAGDLVLQTLLNEQDIFDDDDETSTHSGENSLDGRSIHSCYGQVFDHDDYAGGLNWDDIQLYLYDLSVEEANAKVEEIHTLWMDNCPDWLNIVTKTTASITFFSESPIRPLRISLRLFKNVTEALLHQKLDQSQIGYDGSRVVMTPSCARALETGYTTFKMDSVVGGQYGGPARRLTRFLHYADIGFGVRIMPCSAVALKETFYGQSGPLISQERCDIAAGFKILKDLSRQAASRAKNRLCLRPSKVGHPYVRLCYYETALPGGVRLFGDIRGLFEFSEAWWQIYLDQKRLVPQDPSPLDDELPAMLHGVLPDYMSIRIDEGNDILFEALKDAVCERLQIPTQTTGYGNYLTRRIRRQVWAPTLDAVQEKQITIPIVIPLELDSYLCDIMESIATSQRLLLRVHDPSKHDSQTARLPSLQDVSGPTGNIRYWLITDDTMWAGQDPVLDEISQILWSLFGWYKFVQNLNSFNYPPRFPYDVATPECLFWVVQCLRRRLGPHPLVHSSDDGLRRRQGLLPLREALFFRSFVYQDPPFTGCMESLVSEAAAVPPSPPIVLDDYAEPASLEDEDFFREQVDEGDWVGDGVPAWTNVANINQ